ncbi:MFS transporter [Lacrimispora brassicae]
MGHLESHFNKFILLWSGEFISAIGSGLTSFGLGVYVFQQTGKASALALVTLLAFMPALLLSIPAGVLADRYDRRILMILGDGLSAVGLIFILICMLQGEAKLWQICVGVTISSAFSALLEPACKATVTDLLTPEQYAKASGLIGVAGSAKYLISPILAGMLLTVSDIKLLLIIDIGTLFVTTMATLVVRREIVSRPAQRTTSFFSELKEGWSAVSQNRGMLVLVMMGAVITLFLGFMQTLFAPILLAFSDSAALGITETVCASGMLVSSVLIGMFSIKRGYAKTLSASLFFAGIFMAVFGLYENVLIIGISGFLFFAMLPYANASLDYMLRTNLKNELQGRAWGVIGVISQIGYVAAYALSGVLADAAGTALGTGVGRGSGFLIIIAGILLSLTAVTLYQIKSVRMLEKRGAS